MPQALFKFFCLMGSSIEIFEKWNFLNVDLNICFIIKENDNYQEYIVCFYGMNRFSFVWLLE